MRLIKTTLTDAQAAKLRWGLDLPEDDVPAGAVYIMSDDKPPATAPIAAPSSPAAGATDALRQRPLPG